MKTTHSRSRNWVILSAMLALVLGGWTNDRVTVRAQQAQPAAAKRPVTHQDYDKWRSIQGQSISRDGKFIAYAVQPQDGDGEIVVRNAATGGEWRHTRGWRPPAPPPDISDPAAAAGAFAAMGALTRPRFTADSRFAVFTIEPAKADVMKARKEKKKPEEMPKNALGIMDLVSGQVARIERVRNFQVPEDGGGWIAYQLEAKPEEKKADGPPAAAPAPAAPAARGARGRKKEYGTDLVLRNTATGAERTFAEALEYSFSKDAKSLAYTVSSKKEETNGIFVATPGTDGPAAELLAGKGRYSKISWDEDQTQLAFFSDRDDAESKQPLLKLYHWRRAGAEPADKATAIVSTATPNFRPGTVLSDRAAASFSQDGSRLFLGVAPAPEPEKEAEADSAAEEKVLVDLWHWKDDYIQPMQKVRAEADRNRAYRAVWHLKEQTYLQLSDATMEGANPSSNGLWAIGTDDRAYRVFKGQNMGATDHYLVNTSDGSRRSLLKGNPFGLTFSPNGKYAVYFDGKDWGSVSIPEGRLTNLTKSLGVNFWQEDHDSPSVPSSYGLAGWTKDDQAVLLYDQYDIWQLAPDGSAARNLTDGLGRKEKTEFRYVRLDPQEKFIDPAKPMLLRAENEWTRDSGFYRDRVDGGMPEKLVMAARNFSAPTKARDADVMMLTASRFDEFPDLHLADPNFRTIRKVSDVGAQKNAFVWGKAELVRYKNVDGVGLSGILIKPENFDPARKYPMIVYIYEKLSEGLHRFTNPSPGTSINASYYASNGYLVFMPDIVYTIGYPGQSALKCVLPAIQAVVDKGIVDEKAIGIQGHSWGGYQIAYMVTQTNRFRAAAPGALVGNMTSAYSGIRWGTGLPRQFQYERTQSRIGGSLWEYPMRFIENSPIFYANRVQTPILMLHNDEDDAVPWYQGIEYYLALRRLEKEVYMFNYNGEKHGLRRRLNQKDYTRRLQEFFDYNLKGASKPEWMEQGIRYLDREKEKEKYKTASEAGN
ncbi:MAG: prolyl oligopeptidase family serine peptidase [Blastocatellia bacterium]